MKIEWSVDPETLLFVNLDYEQAEYLEELSSKVIFEGVSVQDDLAFKQWCSIGGFSNNQLLLVMSTIFPNRASLSSSKFFHGLK